MSPPEIVRVLVVDDEPLARDRIEKLLSRRPEIEVVGQCGDGRQAISAIVDLEPDLVFLDIQMPEMDGFEVIQAMDEEDGPLVVFVSAHDAYALRAFEVNALDYILKPFDDRRFEKVLDRALVEISGNGDSTAYDRIVRLREQLSGNGNGAPPTFDGESRKRSPASAYLDRLVIKAPDRIYFIHVNDIEWIEAADYYAKVHAGGVVHVMRESLSTLEEQLDPRQFVRIHRSSIVNLNQVRELRPWFNGAFQVVMLDGTIRRLSRGRRDRFEERLGQSL